jgi:hypothetical protein
LAIAIPRAHQPPDGTAGQVDEQPWKPAQWQAVHGEVFHERIVGLKQVTSSGNAGYVVVDDHDGTLSGGSTGNPTCLYKGTGSGNILTWMPGITVCNVTYLNPPEQLVVVVQTGVEQLTGPATTAGKYTSTFTGTRQVTLDGGVQNVPVAGTTSSTTTCVITKP